MARKPKAVVFDVYACARCGDEHEEFEFKPLTVPIQLMNGAFELTHFALCPELDEPCLIRIEKQAPRRVTAPREVA
jgi:hypothetical protein